MGWLSCLIESQPIVLYNGSLVCIRQWAGSPHTMPIVLYAQWAGSLSYSPLSKTMGWQGVALLSDTAHCQRAGSLVLYSPLSCIRQWAGSLVPLYKTMSQPIVSDNGEPAHCIRQWAGSLVLYSPLSCMHNGTSHILQGLSCKRPYLLFSEHVWEGLSCKRRLLSCKRRISSSRRMCLARDVSPLVGTCVPRHMLQDHLSCRWVLQEPLSCIRQWAGSLVPLYKTMSQPIV